MDDEKALIEEFVTESLEHLQTFEEDVMTLEKSSNVDKEVVDRAFRAVHTIKGGAGFLGFENIQKLSHVMETLLDSIRKGEKECTNDCANALLKGVDTLRNLLSNADVSNDEVITNELSVLEAVQKEETAPAKETKPGEIKEEKVEVKTETAKPQTINGSSSSSSSSLSSNTIRLKVGLLDSLVNLAGELVLTRNQILQVSKGREGPFQELDRITSLLQDNIMRTRMQPLQQLYSRFPRLVREVSQSTGKKVELIMEGGDVELDRSILEALADPMIHLLRNSIDHGIETVEERKSAGKNETGILSVTAVHEGGQVQIAITDDGAGIDHEKIGNKAIEKGLTSKEEIEKLSKSEILNFLFKPGFSTAKSITNISGRGVGLDVVKTAIEGLRGSVEIDTNIGKGTTFKLRVPLTLAIVPALTIKVESETFVIPQSGLVELVRVVEGDPDNRVENLNGADVLYRRGRLTPLVYLSDVLGIPRTFEDPETGERKKDRRRRLTTPDTEPTVIIDEEDDKKVKDRRESPYFRLNVLVLKVGSSQYGLIVDSVGEIQEIVIKRVSHYMKGCRSYAGVTILSDGSVAMVLDPEGIANQANLKFGDVERETARRHEAESTDDELLKLLLFRHGSKENFAVSLDRISRIEKVASKDVQKVGKQKFIKQNGGVIPLVELQNHLPVTNPEIDPDQFYAVVLRGDYPCAVLTTTLDNFIEIKTTLQKDQIISKCVKGTAVINGKLTIVIDPDGIMEESKRAAFNV